MIATRKASGPRVNRLERLACERPCPGCGRLRSPAGGPAKALEWTRLGKEEQRELVGLLRMTARRPCVRCGRAGYDLLLLADEQRHRMTSLLRMLLGRTQ